MKVKTGAVKKQSESSSFVKKSKIKELFRRSGSSSSFIRAKKPAKTVAIAKPLSSVSYSSAGKRKRVGKLHLHRRGGSTSSDLLVM